jgi:putative endonuclease
MRLYWVYILASRPGGAIYIGVTGDLSRRVWDHRQGFGKHTSRYHIHRLVYYESYPDVDSAIQREHNMKHWPRAWKTQLIASMNPTWRDLYEELNWKRALPVSWPGLTRPPRSEEQSAPDPGFRAGLTLSA